VDLARKLEDQVRIRYLEHQHNLRSKSDEPADELFQLEFEFKEDFPMIVPTRDPKRTRQSMRLHTEIRRAELMLEQGQTAAAIVLAERLLDRQVCATDGFSRDVWLMTDSSAGGQVRRILAEGYAGKGETTRATQELCRALDLLWQNIDFFNFSFALDTVTILAWRDAVTILAWRDAQVCIR
jgi:hypothetical protein